MSFTFFIELCVNGLLVGSLYAIVALGFVLIYKASDVINFAQGDFVMFAGYVIAFWILSANFNIVLAAALALVVMVVVGLVVEYLVLRHLIGRPVVAVIMATIGLASFLQGFAQLLFGIETRSFPLPIPDEPIFFGDVLVNSTELVAAGVAGIGFAAVGWFFIKSRYGIAMRCIADDQQVSLAMGINVKRYFALAWAIAGIVALVGAVFWGNATGVDTQLALIGLKVFPVVILGGLDSIVGAIIGGLIIGLVESLAAGFLDPVVGGGMKDLSPYIVMTLVLMFRPYGLFGKPIIERV